MAASPAIFLTRFVGANSCSNFFRRNGEGWRRSQAPALTTAQHGHNALLLPGVIAKRAAGLYYSGKRTREWLKFKAVHEQEVVIVGHTEPRRSRKYFGSLVLAVRGKANKRWSYAGHVGTGFDQAALKIFAPQMEVDEGDVGPASHNYFPGLGRRGCRPGYSRPQHLQVLL
jgi:hypothetical protein